ncbi:hypothetical protein SAMN05414139_09836 [Burkholderia sp. D7]|nr:hypothetical protein SAMN05414139_09836 [Burkholderia sp. D7]
MESVSSADKHLSSTPVESSSAPANAPAENLSRPQASGTPPPGLAGLTQWKSRESSVASTRRTESFVDFPVETTADTQNRNEAPSNRTSRQSVTASSPQPSPPASLRAPLRLHRVRTHSSTSSSGSENYDFAPEYPPAAGAGSLHEPAPPSPTEEATNVIFPPRSPTPDPDRPPFEMNNVTEEQLNTVVDEVDHDAEMATDEIEHAAPSPETTADEIEHAAPPPETTSDRTSVRSMAHGSTHAEAPQNHRDVNNFAHLQAHLPDDVKGCVRYMLTPLREHFATQAEFDDLVDRQTATLEGRQPPINSKPLLMDMMKTMSRRDNLTRVGQGTIGGAHFNGPGIVGTYGPLPEWLAIGSPSDANALQGALGGVIAGVSDAVATKAKAKTFTDAYYTRPDASQLPDALRGVNAGGLATSIKETNTAWVGAFAASYVGRGAITLATTYAKDVPSAVKAEAGLGIATNIAAGIGATFIQHKLDERHGRTGMQYVFARHNLGECIDASRSSNVGYCKKVATGLGNHVGNVVTQWPAGVKDALTNHGLQASTVSLAAGLSVPFTAAGAVAAKFPDAPKTGHALAAVTKYFALEGAWTLWSTAYATGAHLEGLKKA